MVTPNLGRAQSWLYDSPGYPNGNLCDPPGSTIWRGYVGIRAEPPVVPLHIYSGACLTEGGFYDPAVARLQTNAQNFGFGQSSIQFWSGGLLSGQDWQVSSIKPISVALPQIFNTANPISPINWLGGLAFYCSATGQQPMVDGPEVMRLYDQRVAINSQFALGRFDINTRPFDGYGFNPRFVFDNVNESDPVLKFYRPSGNESGSEIGDAYPLWMQYETEAPALLGFAQFHIKGRLWSVSPLGSETSSEMIPRFTILTGNGNVGINQVKPDARLQVTEGAVLFEGTSGNTPRRWTGSGMTATSSELGAGNRLMWIPSKASFRVGQAVGTEWDNPSIGLNSLALGKNVTASGIYSIALGDTILASGHYSSSIGNGSKSTGNYSTAHGRNCLASGYASTAIGTSRISSEGGPGFYTTASGTMSVAIGKEVRALGDVSTAIGDFSDASAYGSLALGWGLNSQAYKSYTFGRGGTGSSRFINNEPESIMFVNGPQTNIPILFLKGGTEYKDYAISVDERLGLVGIATNNAHQARLRVNTTPEQWDFDHDVNGLLDGWETGVVIGLDTWMTSGVPTVPSEDCDLAVQRRVGLGTASPTEKLSVIGGRVIISDDANDVIDLTVSTEVDLAVKRKAVIGGLTFSNGATRDGTRPPKLFVNGDAVKYETTATWDVPSDIRYKKNIAPFHDGLTKLKAINPIWFEFNGKFGLESNAPGVGIAAQEMQKTFPYMIKEDTLKRTIIVKPEKQFEVIRMDSISTKIVDSAKLSDSGIFEYKDTILIKEVKHTVKQPAEYKEETSPILIYNPGPLSYVLVNSVKELDSIVELQKHTTDVKFSEFQSKNDSLQLIIANLQDRLARLEAEKQVPLDGIQDIILEQNNPNPFSDITTITYFVPDKVQGSAELVITPYSQSPILQNYPLTKGIPTQLSISAQDLYTGVFVYSITVGGKVLASKKFIIIK